MAWGGDYSSPLHDRRLFCAKLTPEYRARGVLVVSSSVRPPYLPKHYFRSTPPPGGAFKLEWVFFPLSSKICYLVKSHDRYGWVELKPSPALVSLSLCLTLILLLHLDHDGCMRLRYLLYTFSFFLTSLNLMFL